VNEISPLRSTILPGSKLLGRPVCCRGGRSAEVSRVRGSRFSRSVGYLDVEEPSSLSTCSKWRVVEVAGVVDEKGAWKVAAIASARPV